MTIQEIAKSTTDALRPFSDAPQVDADRIILHALKQREPSYLLSHGNDPLSESQLSAIQQMQDKRKTGMPLAYIVGETDFYGRTFIVTPDVLIPRPDTEALIEKALSAITTLQEKLGRPLLIADLCTGSGCIAITLALEAREHRFIATDISPAALSLAKQNAEKHGVADRIEFIEGDMFTPFEDITIDLIVSNPPYIPAHELSKAEGSQETRGLLFEPRIALDGGIDGLDFVRKIQEAHIPAVIETVGGEIITSEI